MYGSLASIYSHTVIGFHSYKSQATLSTIASNWMVTLKVYLHTQQSHQSTMFHLMEQPFLYTLQTSEGNILDKSGTVKNKMIKFVSFLECNLFVANIFCNWQTHGTTWNLLTNPSMSYIKHQIIILYPSFENPNGSRHKNHQARKEIRIQKQC